MLDPFCAPISRELAQIGAESGVLARTCGEMDTTPKSKPKAMALLAVLASLAASTAALGPGDAMVVGHSHVSSSPHIKYAVVLLDTLQSGETISVTDGGWVSATCAARHAAPPLTAQWPNCRPVCHCPDTHSAMWLITPSTNRTWRTRPKATSPRARFSRRATSAP